MKHMKKLVSTAPDIVEVVDVEVPELQEDEVLIRGVSSLLSPGSELKRVRRSSASPGKTWPNPDLGYAMAGIIERVGDQVDNLIVGDRVVCMRNHQQYVVAKASMADGLPAIPLPDDIDWDAAPFVVWGRSCINWMRRADVQLHETVAVVGCGLVGLLMTMWSRLVDPKLLIAVDLSERRLELAEKSGADKIINAADCDAVQAAHELTGGGTNVTMHCVGGGAVKSFEDSQRMTRAGGRIVLLGHHTESCTLLPFQLTGKDLLGASVGYDYDTQLLLDGLERVRKGKLPVKEIITHKIPFTEAPAIYEMLINNPEDSGAILLDWG